MRLSIKLTGSTQPTTPIQTSQPKLLNISKIILKPIKKLKNKLTDNTK